MLEITEISLQKQTVKTGEQVIITIGIEETMDYPYDYPYDYPIAHTEIGKPEGE